MFCIFLILKNQQYSTQVVFCLVNLVSLVYHNFLFNSSTKLQCENKLRLQWLPICLACFPLSDPTLRFFIPTTACESAFSLCSLNTTRNNNNSIVSAPRGRAYYLRRSLLLTSKSANQFFPQQSSGAHLILNTPLHPGGEKKWKRRPPAGSRITTMRMQMWRPLVKVFRPAADCSFIGVIKRIRSLVTGIKGCEMPRSWDGEKCVAKCNSSSICEWPQLMRPSCWKRRGQKNEENGWEGENQVRGVTGRLLGGGKKDWLPYQM